LVLDGTEIAGRVTSVGWSPTLGRCIGLALVTPAVAAGKLLKIRIEGAQEITADITPPPFYDPAGERQRLGDPA
jgi:sarcosine oxidase subunit alpha